MTFAKKILIAIGTVFIAIQFFRPALNKNYQALDTDISKVTFTSDSVLSILKSVCFDCHSNNTNYPWYSNIQPVSWLLASHIRKGKKEVNFSEFGRYSPRRQISKLNGIANSIKDNIMPLKSYKMMHKNAHLNTSEKALLINWTHQSIDSLSAKN